MGPLDQRLPALPGTEDEHSALRSLFLKAASSFSSWYLGQSDIQGQGIFAGKDFKVGDVIGVAATPGDEDEFGSKIWNLTELARYCNHQWKANTDLVKKDDQFELVASKDIAEDDEITSNYVQVGKAFGRRTTMHWQGKNVPSTDFTDYKELENDEEDSGNRTGDN
jgi:hypothetical protein